MQARRAHMNAEMERRRLELPDPRDLLPEGWQALSDAHKRALYVEAWATLGANIGYLGDRVNVPGWEEPVLPLAEFDLVLVAHDGWCAP